MSGMHGAARVMRWTAGGLGLVAVGYATVAGMTWYRYGRVPSAGPDERDPLLDQFMPDLAHGLARAGDLSPHHRREPRGQAPSDEDHVTATAGVLL